MAQQSINVGTQANDRQGDPLRTAFQKINSNFTELYTQSGATGVFIAPLADMDPTNPIPGQFYYNTTTGKFRGFNGVAAAWQDLN
jgi:hypothetical protein